MRNYIKAWSGKVTYKFGINPVHTTYYLEMDRVWVEEDMAWVTDPAYSQVTTDIQPAYITLNEDIITYLFKLVGRQGTDVETGNQLGYFYEWPFDGFPIVTRESPRKRNDISGWYDEL